MSSAKWQPFCLGLEGGIRRVFVGSKSGPYSTFIALTHWGGILKWISLNENVLISIIICMKFVPRGPINNIPVLVQIMAWHLPGDKPWSESMMVSLPAYIRHSASMNFNAVFNMLLYGTLFYQDTRQYCSDIKYLPVKCILPLLRDHISIVITLRGGLV